jgi:hypothetical protein
VPGTVNLEVSYEELPQLSFDEFSDDYVIPMPFEDEYSQWTPYEDFSRQEREFLIVYLLMPIFYKE